MPESIFRYSSIIDAPPEEVFSWHERSGAFERLTPPWEKVRVVERSGGIKDGAKVVLDTYVGPIKQRWNIEHQGYQENKQFQDILIKGPFSSWVHTHSFESVDGAKTKLTDEIKFKLPLDFGVGSWFVKSKLKRIFRYRHEVTARDISSIRCFGDKQSLNILITGSTGLVGTELQSFLSIAGHRTFSLVRDRKKLNENSAYWNITKNEIDLSNLPKIDAVVHLAGENVASGRWSAEKKRRIRDSRVDGTRLLCEAIVALPTPPKVLVSASAIGIYGNMADQVLNESSSIGSSFLAEVCEQWESTTDIAKNAGVRVVNLRIGAVLSPKGGALGKMLLPFSLGVGGVLGSGKQFMSWIAIDDVLEIATRAIEDESMEGPVNTIAPEPVTNREFTKTLGRVLKRPTIFPVPRFVLTLLFGELADEALLSSARVVPKVLEDNGFEFRYSKLEKALRHVLGR